LVTAAAENPCPDSLTEYHIKSLTGNKKPAGAGIGVAFPPLYATMPDKKAINKLTGGAAGPAPVYGLL